MSIDDDIARHVRAFRRITKLALEDMFACGAKFAEDDGDPFESIYLTEMPFSVRIQFTGVGDGMLTTGEYILATDERVAAACCAVATPDATSAVVASCREDFSSAFSELLNGVVGEAVTSLDELGIVKFGTPRVSYGKMSYGGLEIRRAALGTTAGHIECLFCYDRVLLD